MKGEKTKPIKVLFVCIGNAARSQMAEGFLRKLGGNRFQVTSAGLMPHWRVDPQAVVVMMGTGVDISGQIPKRLEDVDVLDQDVVVTLCGVSNGICPGGFSGEMRDWPVKDPHDHPITVYRAARDEIRQSVDELVAEFSGK